MSKKILFPTDFSDASKNAFIYALQLAESIKAEVITIHVYQLPQANYINISEYLHEIYDVTELSNFENYKDEVPSLRRIAEQNNLGHIKISHALILGNLVPEIKKITENEKIDFVVMGTKGATGLKETFFGTVATKVMNDVKVLVLIIPEHCLYQPIKKMLFLTQYKSEDTAAFKTVLSLSAIFQAPVDCLRVAHLKDESQHDCRADWKVVMEDNEVVFHSIEGDDVEGIILNFIALHKINLIAMHVYHRNFFEKLFEISLAKKLAFHINVPILGIHE
ncbi:nucleotide-binding universal stress UspA family protein [Flavobacterium sp. CG_9.1]|uniref:universal stress protein n=1 Tax=Flavobacterium sp. CG_9.1 TaxID=2787728 RepID=UPI0018CA32D5|nr:universal stress protein [Flavobacterium sp. CG_9.1]MBG6062040.1 nucleotide-binding universal stress UspA family protein [Flavobacterium sp. CG_9.1]